MLAWDQFVLKLEKELGTSTVNQWIRPLKVVRFDAGNLFLEARDSFQIDWFEEHIRPLLNDRFVNNNLRPIRVHLSTPTLSSKINKEKPTSFFSILPDRIDPEFTFEHFLSFPQNDIAYKLLTEIDRPTFNPIYLYGPKHAGKTHLLTASAILLQKKGRKVFFVRAETFTSHVVQAIRLGHMQQFRQNYREIDALLIDDIDIFSRKNATQEEFFHTFNALHTSGRQVILTASVPPTQLSEIEPRLISRFEWGISIAIGKGEALAILERKSTLWGLSYSQTVLQFLSEKFPSNPVLALQALSLRSKGMDSLTTNQAEILLKDLLQNEEEKALTPDKIIKVIAAHFGIKPEDLLSKSQMREMAYPRQIAMYLCREKLQLPFQKIGKMFYRDHSTVMSSVKQIQKGLDNKEEHLLDAIRSVDTWS